MLAKRYTEQELITLCEEAFYSYMLNGERFYRNFRAQACTLDSPTPAHALRDKYINVIEENMQRVALMDTALKSSNDEMYQRALMSQIEYLHEEREILKYLDMQYQRLLYENRTEEFLMYSRSNILFPLNKCINSYYDDLWLDVLFYDNVCTPAGHFDEFMSLPESERKQFLKNNTEITHMGLQIAETNVTIILKGHGNTNNDNVLPSEYGNFKELSLKKLDELRNNDLRQFLQNKIDLDEENLQLLATEYIRGDEYKLYRRNTGASLRDPYYIRYVCASTGRVYFNGLNLTNLAVSDYFDQKDYASYLRAWWNITHLGARIEGKAVVSC